MAIYYFLFNYFTKWLIRIKCKCHIFIYYFILLHFILIVIHAMGTVLILYKSILFLVYFLVLLMLYPGNNLHMIQYH